MAATSPPPSGKRTDHLSKECWYMSMAILASQRSKDPATQVGCAIVNTDGIVLAMGYNGFPVGCSDDELPWSKGAEDPLDNKFPFVVHAEANAILNTNDESVHGCTLYATLFPCNECAKLIIQSGIAEVVYLCDKSKDKPLVQASRRMFDLAGVKYRQYKERNHRKVVIDFAADVPKAEHRDVASPQRKRDSISII
eukprot:TRINITY_DN7855_c0_g1_i1.p1 TRINITY_DN7855_c0_g1~~TRINITY_DN7855_c0_g1_i1.p1  ORF type:complete len:196 (+),score=32.60 TRINITY_DN7855_c0_g1_i1:94-681(+)